MYFVNLLTILQYFTKYPMLQAVLLELVRQSDSLQSHVHETLDSDRLSLQSNLSLVQHYNIMFAYCILASGILLMVLDFIQCFNDNI